jgi:hypothetical protein
MERLGGTKLFPPSLSQDDPPALICWDQLFGQNCNVDVSVSNVRTWGRVSRRQFSAKLPPG